MKVTFEDILSKKEWLHTELLKSLDNDTITKCTEAREYDVKLLVNGKELEPKFYNDLVNNIEKYIDRQAESIVNDNLYVSTEKARMLEQIVQEATEKIREEFNIKEEDY